MSRIPEIDSIEELAKFWDRHDITDFEEVLEEAEMNHDAEQSNLALEPYRIIAAYLQHENTVYWQRGQLFLVANAALLGFSSQKLPLLSADQPLEWIIVCMILAVAGLFLTRFWHRSLMAGEFWVRHWHLVLRVLEPQAFDGNRLFRHFKPDRLAPRRVRARAAAVSPVWLF